MKIVDEATRHNISSWEAQTRYLLEMVQTEIKRIEADNKKRLKNAKAQEYRLLKKLQRGEPKDA